LKRIFVIFLLVFISQNIFALKKIFHRKKVQVWVQVGGLSAPTNKPAFSSVYAIAKTDDASNSRGGLGPGLGLNSIVAASYKWMSVQVEHSYLSNKDLFLDQEGGKTFPGTGYIHALDFRAGYISTNKKGHQQYTFLYAGFAYRLGAFDQTKKVETSIPGETAYQMYGALIGFQRVTLFKIAKRVYLGPVLGLGVGYAIPGAMQTPSQHLSMTDSLAGMFLLQIGIRLAIKRFFVQTGLKANLAAGQGTDKNTNQKYNFGQGFTGISFSSGFYF